MYPKSVTGDITMIKKLIVLLIITFAPVPAVQAAAEPLYNQVYERCMEASAGITVNMHDCMEAERVRLDKKLNSAYKELMKLLNKDSQERLRQTQRSWLKYLELNGAYIFESRQGNHGLYYRQLLDVGRISQKGAVFAR